MYVLNYTTSTTFLHLQSRMFWNVSIWNVFIHTVFIPGQITHTGKFKYFLSQLFRPYWEMALTWYIGYCTNSIRSYINIFVKATGNLTFTDKRFSQRLFATLIWGNQTSNQIIWISSNNHIITFQSFMSIEISSSDYHFRGQIISNVSFWKAGENPQTPGWLEQCSTL